MAGENGVPRVSAFVQPASRLADPLEVFIARCDARAWLFDAAGFDLHEAVDVLQEAAVATGLVDRLGQDEVQRIIAEAFAPPEPCTDEPRDRTEEKVDDQCTRFSSTFADACKIADVEYAQMHQQKVVARWFRLGVSISTLRAACYLINQSLPDRLGLWLAKHTKQECAAIVAYIDDKKAA